MSEIFLEQETAAAAIRALDDLIFTVDQYYTALAPLLDRGMADKTRSVIHEAVDVADALRGSLRRAKEEQ